MPPIGKNADCFFAFHRAEGPYQASRQGRAASSSMELFKGVWGQCHQQANADVLIHLPCLPALYQICYNVFDTATAENASAFVEHPNVKPKTRILLP